MDLNKQPVIKVLEYVAGKQRKGVIKVESKGTFQYYWECLNRVLKG